MVARQSSDPWARTNRDNYSRTYVCEFMTSPGIDREPGSRNRFHIYIHVHTIRVVRIRRDCGRQLGGRDALCICMCSKQSDRRSNGRRRRSRQAP